MSNADPEPPLPPYTGRVGGPASVAAEVDAVLAERYSIPPADPRIRWSRIATLQLGAGMVAGFAVPALLFGFSGGDAVSFIPLALLSAAIVGLVGGGVPLLFGWIVWALVSRARRGPWREVVAVAGGALLGSIVISVVMMTILGVGGFAAVIAIGVPSAIGFAVWVLVAWGPHLRGLPVR